MANGIANARDYRDLSRAHLPHRLGAIASFLEDRGVTTGIAPYWIAYDLTFRTGGRAHIASSDLVRIPAYQEEYEAHRDHAVRIDLGDCAAGSAVIVYGISLCVR